MIRPLDSEALQRQLPGLDDSALENFNRIKERLLKRGVSAEIMERHQNAVERYKAEIGQLLTELDEIIATKDGAERDQKARKALKHLKNKRNKRSQQPFDPNNLPNRSLKPDSENKPKSKAEDFARAKLFDTPYPKLAGLGDFTFDKLDGASNPAFLAATDEVVLSQAIKDKAAELEHDPVKIYHWARNNITWLPSWGGIQDADLTLSARRGNAMDIASLTLALLRASKIPARYVHGTIDVPVESFNNWAGGFGKTEAALEYASSAGIPVTALFAGGKIATVRMEHVWVEAAIDYLPSRGAVNKDADSWVAMDPSFKQYEYLQGLDAVGISGINPEQLAQDFINSGTVNETESWVTGFDGTMLENAQTEAQQKLEAYIKDNMTDPTVGDVVGGHKTIVKEYPVLPSSLPNRVVVSGARYDKLPSALQQRITYAFGRDILGDLIAPVSFPFAKVNNQKITLSFKPATEADEEALLSLLPEGEITDLSQLPTSIPSYLVNVVPELKLNGEVVKSGSAMQLGEELDFITAMHLAGRGQAQPPRSYYVIAGSYLVVNAYSGSVSPQVLQAVQARLQNTKTVLESADEAQIGALTRQELLGDLFHAGGLGYYAQLGALSYLMGLQAGGHHLLAAGTGTFGYEPNVDYFFGFPQAVRTGGVVFDIPLLNVFAVDDGDADRRRQFALQTGILSSALEHAVPEQMFVNAENPGEAISAVKALQKASSAGQRIYHVTRDNQASVLAAIHHDAETMDEIRNALNAGKEVITHTDAVSVPGWSGAGYIIVDPETGDGAYKISGGGNGGFLDWWSSNGTNVGLVLALVSLLTLAFPVAPILLFILSALSVFVAIMSILTISLQTSEGGCPDGMGALGVFIEFAAIVFSFLGPSQPIALAIATWLSFFTGSTISGVAASNVCKGI